jgi:drug/metabolite transporter (DMT)-like permease
LTSIFFGLAAALGWGAADFTGGLASRRTAAYQVVMLGEALGLVMLLLGAPIFREPIIPLSDWLWCSAAGVTGILGLWILYRALAQGQMSIAAPVSALMAAFLPVIAGSLLEGVPGWTKFIGFALALVAVWLISQTGNPQSGHIQAARLLLPLLSGVGFGLYFILFHQGSRHGLLWPMVASRSSGALTVAFLTSIRRQPWRPAPRAWPLIALNALLDISGNAFYVLASQTGRMDVAAVLASLYPGSTVILAWILLRERITRAQWLGILIALGAIVSLTI